MLRSLVGSEMCIRDRYDLQYDVEHEREERRRYSQGRVKELWDLTLRFLPVGAVILVLIVGLNRHNQHREAALTEDLIDEEEGTDERGDWDWVMIDLDGCELGTTGTGLGTSLGGSGVLGVECSTHRD
eukprot:TRINITY_DN17505_c0_g1_i1.p1 TRINITY_DN17505_c0_g1~~TRINITY_DN17505_c0_g1_i1.p1  ORF type:complete len:128 (+),score=20.87 TRINITY_DN17505_c0_g1_i1:145-528(+)